MWFVTFNFQHKDLGNKQIQPPFSRRPLGSTRPRFPLHIVLTRNGAQRQFFPASRGTGALMSCERTLTKDSVQIYGELNVLNKSNSMLSLIQSNLIGKVSGSDLSVFFQSMSALNKFFSSSNTAARKGKHIYVQKWNKVRSVDLFAGTEEERVHNWGEAFDDLLLSSLHKFLRHLLLSKSWKMDKQVSKHELEKNLVSENQSWMGHF